MLYLKRFFLLIMVLVVPVALTAGSYVGAEYMLVETHRFIAPQTMRLVTIVEFAVFFFIAVLEARARWSAHPSR